MRRFYKGCPPLLTGGEIPALVNNGDFLIGQSLTNLGGERYEFSQTAVREVIAKARKEEQEEIFNWILEMVLYNSIT